MQPVWALQSFEQTALDLNGKEYRIEIADTPARRTQGLMYRKSIAQNEGMLFVQDYPQTLLIWMKNTLIPLSVLWLDSDATIVHREQLQPCLAAPCSIHGPRQRVSFVLELHSDEAQRFNVGDHLPAVLKWQRKAPASN